MSFESLHEQMNDGEDYRNKFLLGTVVDISDPDGTERVKATIPGIYDTPQDCVWIGPAKKSAFGQGKGWGTFGVPALGSTLLVELQDGDPHHPIYHGCLVMQGHKVGEQVSKFHERAWGFEDPDHNQLVVDLKAHTTTFTSNSKVKFVISAQGDLTITIPKDMRITVGGDLNAQVSGSAEITADGPVNINGSVIHLNGG